MGFKNHHNLNEFLEPFHNLSKFLQPFLNPSVFHEPVLNPIKFQELFLEFVRYLCTVHDHLTAVVLQVSLHYLGNEPSHADSEILIKLINLIQCVINWPGKIV